MIRRPQCDVRGQFQLDVATRDLTPEKPLGTEIVQEVREIGEKPSGQILVETLDPEPFRENGVQQPEAPRSAVLIHRIEGQRGAHIGNEAPCGVACRTPPPRDDELVAAARDQAGERRLANPEVSAQFRRRREPDQGEPRTKRAFKVLVVQAEEPSRIDNRIDLLAQFPVFGTSTCSF